MIKKMPAPDSGRKLSTSDEFRHYNAVIIEHFNSQMQQVTEGMMSIKEELSNKIDEVQQKTDVRFDIIEAVLREHSKEIKILKTDVTGLKTDVAGLKTDVAGIKDDMRAMETRLSRKIDGNNARLDDHETRITTLESVHP